MANGSSPRVRGTHVPENANQNAKRFIPARAGNATRVILPSPSHTVHPRACGERTWIGCAHEHRRGSSPRVRGTLFPETVVFTPLFTCQRTHRLERLFRSPFRSRDGVDQASD